ncbi:hypothetical protein C8F01DRAFT_1284555 [Mycena amicta]|nr:hypothetical protein C8F01DRAFT_1284555 [Mycena amicta]
MTTPHRSQRSSATLPPATQSRWMNLKRLMPSRGSSPIRSGSPSDGTAANIAITWLDALLQRAQMGATANEAFTPAKDVFQSVVVLLEDVKKMKNNQKVLKDLCEKILSTLQTLQDLIQARPSDASIVQLKEKCQDFQQLLHGVSEKIEEIKNAKSSGHLKFKQFVLPSGIASAIASYEKNITDFQEELKLLAVPNTNPTSNEPAGAQIIQSNEPMTLAAILPVNVPRWFADTFSPELARSHIEHALAGSITDIIQAISDHLTDPIRASLNYGRTLLEKVQILFGHLDAQFGHAVLVHSFQEAVLTIVSRAEPIFFLGGHWLQPPGNNIFQQRLVQEEIQTIRSCPPPSKFFRGRQDILLQLEGLFQLTELKEQKVVLLHGLGGAGKTQIALRFISECGSRFTNQFKINASSAETIQAGYRQIAMAKKLGDTAEAAQTWLKANQAEWLLLFDNADKPDLDLGEYLPQCTHGNILITSRNPGLWAHTGSREKAIAVSNLSLNDAVLLLLSRAGVELELHCFALAIVQAGAFIAKSPPVRQNLSKYIPLYQENKATLLSKKPEQAHEDYEWTVYTTWQISFDQLRPQAVQFLQLCSFIHVEGITEDIFKRASKYTPKNGLLDPNVTTLQPTLNFLSYFRSAESKWNSLAFEEMMSDICDYSLMTWQNDAYSIHPLVHQWSKTIISDLGGQRKLMVALLGMAAAYSVELLQRIRLLLHMMLFSEDDDIIGTGLEGHFGDVFQAGGMFRRVKTLRSDILMRSNALLSAEHPDTIRATANLAETFRDLGQYTDAEKEQVLEKRTRLLGAEHPNTIRATANLAATLRDLGQYTDAEKLEEQVLEKRTKVLDAQELQEQVLEKRTRLLGAEHPNTIQATANLAVTFSHLGRYTDAQELEEQVLEKQTRLLGAEHPNTIQATANLAVTFSNLGRYTEAQELDEQVLEKQTKVLGAEHPDTIQATANLAGTFSRLGWYTDAQELQEQVLEKRTRLLGAEHLDTIWATANLAGTFSQLGQYTDAQELQEQVLEKQTRLIGAEHPNTIQATANLAVTFSNLGRYTDAQELEEQVLEKQTRLLGAEHPNTIQATANLAVTFSNLGRYTEAQELDEQVLEKQTKVLGAEHPDTIRATANLAGTFSQLGRYTDAQELEEQVLEKQTRLLGAEHPYTIRATANLAATFRDLGQYTDAEKLQEQVLEKRTKVLGAEHPDTIRATANLAGTFSNLGRYTEAQELDEQVLEKQTKVLGAEHPDTIRATANLAGTFSQLGRYTDAQELEEQVLEKQTRLLGAEHPYTIRATANLAATFRDLGQYTDAEKLQEQVLEKRTKVLGAEHPDTIRATANLAGTFSNLGRYTEAQELDEQVLEKQTKVLGAEHPDTIRATANLAGTFSQLGRYTDAQELEEQVLEKQTRLLGAEHPNTIQATANLAATLRNLGRYRDAQELEKQTPLQQQHC